MTLCYITNQSLVSSNHARASSLYVGVSSYSTLKTVIFSGLVEMADFSPEGWRFYVFARHKLGDSAAKITQDLVVVLGDTAPSYRTVARWVEAFRAGREHLEDDPRSGRPVEVMTKEKIAQVKALVDDDRNITVALLSEECGISVGSVSTILHEHLQLRKICARWVPHMLSQEQKQERVRCSREFLEQFAGQSNRRLSDIVTGDEKWFYYFQVPHKHQNKEWLSPEDPRPTVLRSGFRSRKQMFVVFLSINGPVEVVMVPNGQNVNAGFYTEQVLPRVLQSVAATRPQRLRDGRIHIHHDNASSHTAAKTRDFITENCLKPVAHPPYSPDLAPCDFWAFPKLTERMAGCNFSREQDLARRINQELKSIPLPEYAEMFQAWIRRHRRCVEVRGEYIEGL